MVREFLFAVTDTLKKFKKKADKGEFRDSIDAFFDACDPLFGRDDVSERVFTMFKQNFDDFKLQFEDKPGFSEKLYWDNFIKLLELSAQDLVEKAYYPVDADHADYICDAVENLRRSWDKIHVVGKIDLADYGIVFEGYDNIRCLHMVEGIANSDTPNQMRGQIVKQYYGSHDLEKMPPLQPRQRSNVLGHNQP